jgi:hypothetical protein
MAAPRKYAQQAREPGDGLTAGAGRELEEFGPSRPALSAGCSKHLLRAPAPAAVGAFGQGRLGHRGSRGNARVGGRGLRRPGSLDEPLRHGSRLGNPCSVRRLMRSARAASA